MFGASSESMTVSFSSTVAVDPGRSRETGRAARRTSSSDDTGRPEHRHHHGLAHLDRRRRAGAELDAVALRPVLRHPRGEGRRIQIRDRDDGARSAHPKRAGDLGGIHGDRRRVVVDVEHDLVAQLHRPDRVRGDRAAHQNHGACHRLSGNVAADVARRRVEPGGRAGPAHLEHHARLRRLQPAARDRIPLEPGAVGGSGLETEAAELVGHVLRRHLEAAARRVAPHHRVVRDDADPARHVAGR